MALVFLALLGSMWFGKGLTGGRTVKEMDYGEFYQSLKNGKIAEVRITDNKASIKLRGNDQENVRHTVLLPTQDRASLNVALEEATKPLEDGVNVSKPKPAE